MAGFKGSIAMRVTVRIGSPAVRSVQAASMPRDASVVTCTLPLVVPTYTVFESEGATPIDFKVPRRPPVRSRDASDQMPPLSGLRQRRYVPKYIVSGFDGSIARGE